MKNRTFNALIKMGIPADISGFRYIVEAICLLDEPKWRNEKTTILYEEIAKMSNVKASNVERAIRHAFSYATKDARVCEEVEKYLPTKKNSNGNLLHVLYIKLKQEEEQENAD